jgi:hypothetical protein
MLPDQTIMGHTMIAIYTKYIPATDRKGSRIKAYDVPMNGDKMRSVSISYPHELSGEMVHFEAVKAFVAKHLKYAPSLDEMRYGNAPNGYVFCFAQSIVGK